MKCGVVSCVLVRCLQECREQVSSAQSLEWKNLDIPALDLKSQHTMSRKAKKVAFCGNAISFYPGKAAEDMSRVIAALALQSSAV